MAKHKPEEKREETRKQTTRRRRDAEATRKVLIGLVAVGVLLLLIIGAGIVQELLVKPNQPVATVNDARVTIRDYQKLVKYSWLQAGQVTDPEGTSVQVLDQAIDLELLREQAKQRNIVVTEDEITTAIEERFGYQRLPPTPIPTATPDPSAPPSTEPTATPAPTATPVTLEAYQTTYKNYLQRISQYTGMNEREYRASIEGELLQQKMYEEISKDVPTTTEQVRIRHILIAIRTPGPTAEATADPNATPAPTATPTPEPRDEAQALALAVEIRSKLGAGEDFATLATQYTDDPGSKAAGGELGWYAKGQGLVQAFEDAAFALEVGQISDPVKTDFGYHIIQVEERDPARALDAYSAFMKKYEAYQAWLTEVRNAAKIERSWSLDKVPPTPSAGQF